MAKTAKQPIGAIYVRSASSLAEGASALDVQRTQLEEYAALESVQIVKIYTDLGISGISKPEQRPGLAALLEDAHKGEFNVMYITGLDRLGRRAEYVNEIIGQLRDAGVKIKVDKQGEVKLNEELLECVKSLKKVMMRAQSL
jgi:DNA invertase Pin-like site-specific DNA recombinase